MPARRRAGAASSELAQLLVALRGDLSQTAAAQRTGIPQPRISRAETDKYLLTEDEVARYGAALDATPDQLDRLLELTRAARTRESFSGRRQLTSNARVIQRKIGDLERTTRLLRSWVPDVVPGLMQTRAYTVALIGFNPTDAWWEARNDRLAVLDDPDRELHILIGEAVLRWGIGSPEVMRDQLRHLLQVAKRPNMRFGIVPLDAIYPIACPRGFHVYGDDDATVATDVGTTFVTGEDVARFITDHAAVAEIAAYGEDAERIVRRVLRRY